MSKKTINDMSLDEIFQEIGSEIKFRQVRNMLILNHLDNVEKIDLDRLNQHNYLAYLKDHIDYFDKKDIVFMIAINLNHILGSIKKTDFRKENNIAKKFEIAQNSIRYEKAIQLLKDTDVEIPIIVDGIELEEFLTVEQFLGEIKNPKIKQKNTKIVENLKQRGILKDMMLFADICDFKEFCYNKRNGQTFSMALANLLLTIKTENNLQKIKEVYYRKYEEYIERFPEKIDMEKWLLLVAYRAKNALEVEEDIVGSEFEQDILRVIQNINDILKNSKTKIEGNFVTKTGENRKHITYSANDLRKDASRIVNGNYYSNTQLVAIKKQILEGVLPISVAHMLGIMDLLKLTLGERKRSIAKNPNNLEHLVKNAQLPEEDIKECLDKIENFNMNYFFVDELYANGIIDKEDMVKLYRKNNLDLSSMNSLNEIHDLNSEVTVEDLVKYYFESQKDDKKIKDFDRYALLFREFKIKGKTPEEEINLADEIIEELYKTESDYDQDLKNLYQSNLLPIRSLRDWNGEQMIYDLIEANILKPKDTKDLLLSGELNLDKACEALQKSNLSETEKWNFIFSSFDGISKTPKEEMLQNEARMKLFQTIHVAKDLHSTNEKGHKITQKQLQNQAKQKTKFVIDSGKRWQYFSLLDEDFCTEAFLDGTVIFTLPNVQNGTVIVEKMLKCTKNGNKLDYGVATYHMSEEEFYNRKSEILQDKKVNRKVLMGMSEEGKATKLIHSRNWGNRLKAQLGISEQKGYTKEKLERIDQLVASLEKSKERVD